MIPAIKELFTDRILNEAMARYDIDPGEIRSLGGFESFVYEYKQGDALYILKITHTIRRTKEYIQGKIEWIDYLSERGLTVSKAVPSVKGNLVEEIRAAEGCFLIIAYEKAPGSAITEEVWNESLFEKWGELLGRIHCVTKDYVLSSPRFKRQEWEEEEQLRADKYLRPDDVTIPLVEERMRKLHALPRSRDTYGLVHADSHQRNFYLHGEDIYLFDFDDCSYTYFINDIGITLYYALCFPVNKFEDKADYYKRFFRCFMKGYIRENTVSEEEISCLHEFIKLRHTLNYIIFHQVTDLTQLNEQQWSLLSQHQAEIATEDPMLPIDFVYEFKHMLAHSN